MEQLSKKETLQAWADITVKNWKEKIRKFKIGDSQKLNNSFTIHIAESAGGDIEKITFLFEYYGKFVDMGVGKGTKIGDVKELSISRRLEGKTTGNRRRAKKWYGKTLYSEVISLSEIMQEKYGEKAINDIVERLQKTA